MNIKQLKEKLSKVDLLSTFPFINGYGISTKYDNETGQDKLVIDFKVSEKIVKTDLKKEYILPKSLSSYGIDIDTKVSKELKSNVDYVNLNNEIFDYYNLVTETDKNSIENQNFYTSYLNYEAMSAVGYSDNGDVIQVNRFYQDNANINPVKYNRQKARPLSGGCSSIYTGGTDATLGLLVRDKQDRSIVALSNSHVYSDTLLIGEEAKRFGSVDNILSLSGRQPGANRSNPYGDINPIVDHIGIPKRTSYMSRVNARNTYVDAAILELSSYDLIDSSSNSVLWFKEKGPYSFASEDELYSLIDPSSINYQSPVFRSGRTLGPLGYPGNVNEDTTTLPLNTYLTPTNLTPYLSTSDGVNITTSGLCAIKYESQGYYRSDDEAYILYQSSDREKVFITGNRYYYNYKNPSSSVTLFNDLTGTDDDVELCIEDSNKIKMFGINRANFSSYYVDDNNKIYFAGQRPSSSTINVLKDPYFSSSYATPFTELVHNNSEITNGGVQKIFSDPFRSYILTEDNKLFVRGVNREAYSYHNYKTAAALGYGSSTQQFNSYTKIPGEWLDFTTLDSNPYSNFLLAISGDNRLYAAFTHQYSGSIEKNAFLYSDFLRDDYTNVDSVKTFASSPGSTTTRTFCASFDLTSNRIPITIDGDEVFVKEFVTKDKNYGACDRIWPSPNNFLNLVTTDNKLIALQGKYYSDDDNNAYYIKYNNEPIIWNDKCRKIGSTNNSHLNPGIISGGDIFIYGENMNINYRGGDTESFAKHTNFPLSSVYDENWKGDNLLVAGTSAFKYEEFPNFDIASGYFAFYSTNDSPNSYQSSFVYSDTFGVSALGKNFSNTFFNEKVGIKDEVIVTNVNEMILVDFNGRTILCNDIFSIQSKEKSFPVSQSGDSGSAVFALLSSTVPTASAWKFIGLIFAGPSPSNSAKGRCISVENIVNELDIEPWEGNIEE